MSQNRLMLIHLYAVYAKDEDSKADAEAPALSRNRQRLAICCARCALLPNVMVVIVKSNYPVDTCANKKSAPSAQGCQYYPTLTRNYVPA